MPFELLTSQRNAFFSELRAASLNPADFEWTSRSGESLGWLDSYVPALAHKSRGFFFAIADSPWGGYNIAYSPGQDVRTAAAQRLIWDAVAVHIGRWATATRRELRASDMWEQIARETRPLAASAEGLDNSRFTPAEIRRIDSGLQQLAVEVESAAALVPSQVTQLLDAVKDMRAAAERIGRKDWVMLAIGTIVSTVAAAALPPEAIRAVLRAASAALQAAVGHPVLSPGI